MKIVTTYELGCEPVTHMYQTGTAISLKFGGITGPRTLSLTSWPWGIWVLDTSLH